MSIPIEALEAEVLGLSAAERSRLLDRLIASLDADPEIEQAWMQLARQRDEEIESGLVETVPIETALRELRASLR